MASEPPPMVNTNDNEDSSGDEGLFGGGANSSAKVEGLFSRNSISLLKVALL